MKKILTALLCASLLLAAGCSGPQNTTSENQNPQKTQEAAKPTPDPFYTKITSSDERPIAIMIDNDDKTARPQVGLDDAYVVYEATVEGQATRMMAVFKNSNLDKIGPVRSSRHYFLDYAMEHDAIYVHAGWSPKAASDISSLKINNINGITGTDGSCFWRDNTYNKTWHNLYTSLEKLKKHAADKKNYRMTTEKTFMPYHETDTPLDGGEDILSVSLPYASFYKLTYNYNTQTKMYERFINGSPHTSQTGVTFGAKNLLVLYVKNYMLADTENKGRQDMDTVGTGNGYYLTDGKMVDITWSKKSRSEKSSYKTADGHEIVLNPGVTWIQIIDPSKTVTFE